MKYNSRWRTDAKAPHCFISRLSVAMEFGRVLKMFAIGTGLGYQICGTIAMRRLVEFHAITQQEIADKELHTSTYDELTRRTKLAGSTVQPFRFIAGVLAGLSSPLIYAEFVDDMRIYRDLHHTRNPGYTIVDDR